MSKTDVQFFSFEELEKFLGITPVDYIEYEPALSKTNPDNLAQFEIIRSNKSDGTFIFTKELMLNSLLPLYLKSSYYIPEDPGDNDVSYKIGPLKLETTYGKYEINGMTINGQQQVVTIPVKVINLNQPLDLVKLDNDVKRVFG